jgi:hypothetical protein
MEVVKIKTNIRRLAGLDCHPLKQRVGIVRQGQQPRCFLGESLADTDGVIFGTAAIRCQAATPGIGLDIEVLHVGEVASGKKTVSHVADGAFNLPFSFPRAMATGRGS